MRTIPHPASKHSDSATERERTPSGVEAGGVAREHGGLADVVEPHEEHHHPLEPDAAARVRPGAVLERVDVVPGVEG